jgi:predicted small lipoprotein YifL
MTRLALTLVAVAIAAVPLAACGKKGDPQSDPPTLLRTYPKPDKTIPTP